MLFVNGIEFIFVSVLLAFGYRWLRNGAFSAYLPSFLSGDTFSRLAWGWTYLVAAFIVTLDVRLSFFVIAIVSQQIAIRIPHGFAMNVGSRDQRWEDMGLITVGTFFGHTITLPKWWPALWMTRFKESLGYTAQDVLGLLTVGAIRGLVCFVPLAAIGYEGGPAFAWVAVTTPLAYYVSRFIPFDFYGVHARTIEWAEVLHGPLVWAPALFLAAGFLNVLYL